MFNTIGLGYIGLRTATLLASRKKKVIGADVNQHAVDTINQGTIHIIEPQLDRPVQAAVTQGYPRATTQPEPAEAFLSAAPTPFIHHPSPLEGISLYTTCKLLILFPSPSGRGVRGEGGNLRTIKRLAHTPTPSAFWSRACVDTDALRERAGAPCSCWAGPLAHPRHSGGPACRQAGTAGIPSPGREPEPAKRPESGVHHAAGDLTGW